MKKNTLETATKGYVITAKVDDLNKVLYESYGRPYKYQKEDGGKVFVDGLGEKVFIVSTFIGEYAKSKDEILFMDNRETARYEKNDSIQSDIETVWRVFFDPKTNKILHWSKKNP